VGSATGGANNRGLSKQRDDLVDFPGVIADLVELQRVSRRDRRSRHTASAFQTRSQISLHCMRFPDVIADLVALDPLADSRTWSAPGYAAHASPSSTSGLMMVFLVTPVIRYSG
jgi:hypothetical protein